MLCVMIAFGLFVGTFLSILLTATSQSKEPKMLSEPAVLGITVFLGVCIGTSLGSFVGIYLGIKLYPILKSVLNKNKA